MKKGVDHTGVAVVFFCHDGQGSFILGKRSKYCRDEHGRWDPGGGAVKLHEVVERTLVREIKEEYCTDVINSEFLGFRDVHRTDEKKRKTHWLCLDFKVLVDKKKVSNGVPRKLQEIDWFRLNSLPQPLHSQFPDFIRRYRERLR